MMNERIQPFIKTLLLVALGVFFYSRIANGTLLYYINERFAIFTVIGVVGLLLLGVSYRWERQPSTDDSEQTHHDGCEHDGCEHDHSHSLSWASMLIIALPIVLGLLITPQPLGSAAPDPSRTAARTSGACGALRSVASTSCWP